MLQNFTVQAAQLDNAALLRQMAQHLEENEGLAVEFGRALAPDSAQALRTALERVEYAVHEPAARALRRVALRSGVPFIGIQHSTDSSLSFSTVRAVKQSSRFVLHAL
jgi:hypothetical protein